MVDPELIRETFNQGDKPVLDRLQEVAALGREDALEEVREVLGNLLWEQQRLYLPNGGVSETLETVIERIGEL